jgi:hypothetical protein
MESIRTEYQKMLDEAVRQPGVKDALELFNSCRESLEIVSELNLARYPDLPASASNSSNILHTPA